MHANKSQLWMVGGLVGAVAMLAVGWFVLIGPQRSTAAGLHDDAATAAADLVPLQRDLADLRVRSAKLPQYKAELARKREALPTTAGISDFLRTLQTTGELTHVTVSGLAVGAPVQLGKTTPIVYTMPLAITAAGLVPALVKFLDQLQLVQPRAVLISNVNFAPRGESGSFGGPVTLTLSVQAYLAPATDTPPAPKTN
jgi:Tfp pilus assembly protein PilO